MTRKYLTFLGFLISIGIVLPGLWLVFHNRPTANDSKLWVIVPPWSTQTKASPEQKVFFHLLIQNLYGNMSTSPFFVFGEHVNFNGHLQAYGLVRSAFFTKSLGRFYGFKEQMKPGIYYLCGREKPSALLQKIIRGQTSRYVLVLPGDTLSKIAQKLIQSQQIRYSKGFISMVKHPQNLAKWKNQYGFKTLPSIEPYILPGLYAMGDPEFTDRDLEAFKDWGADTLDKVRHLGAELIRPYSKETAEKIKTDKSPSPLALPQELILGARFNRQIAKRFYDEIGKHFLQNPHFLAHLPATVRRASRKGGAPSLDSLMKQISRLSK